MNPVLSVLSSLVCWGSRVALMEAVPEFTPERAPVTTFSPRRAVGLMSDLKRASDSEPSPERAPVPVHSPRRAPVPEFIDNEM